MDFTQACDYLSMLLGGQRWKIGIEAKTAIKIEFVSAKENNSLQENRAQSALEKAMQVPSTQTLNTLC